MEDKIFEKLARRFGYPKASPFVYRNTVDSMVDLDMSQCPECEVYYVATTDHKCKVIHVKA